ncbi:hypothetical protein CPB85DRAFT_1216070 [Mucidula mucida]|nr:hypothetical protein CPB85DRAFT_1216070 [Mucidula mucida]
MALALALFSLQSILCVQAALYVIVPASGSTCHGGEECTVQWLDNGEAPLLASFGVCSVGLYTGDNQLVQTIEPLDVSASHSLTFTPIPEAGPTSDT